MFMLWFFIFCFLGSVIYVLIIFLFVIFYVCILFIFFLIDINECNLNFCWNGGNCIDLVNGYVCKCFYLWKG